MDHANFFKTIIAFLAAGVTYFFGRPDIWLISLMIVVVLDYMTGMCKAWILGELSSKTGFKGIVRKMMYFAIVAVSVVADNITGASGVLRVAVIGFLVANEALSILENCAAANLPVPKMLIKALGKLKSENEDI